MHVEQPDSGTARKPASKFAGYMYLKHPTQPALTEDSSYTLYIGESHSYAWSWGLISPTSNCMLC